MMPSVRAAMTARVVMMLFLFQDCCALQMTKDVMAVGTDDSTLSSLSVEIGQAGDITANSRTIHRMGMNGEASHGTNNLCMFGKLVPEVMIIGVQKAATSTFYSRLASNPSIYLPSDGWEKYNLTSEPLPFFLVKEKHVYDYMMRYGEGRSHWLKSQPKCPENERKVEIDATPDYLSSYIAPYLMKSRYEELASRLKFIVILRDPVARTHSGFYNGRRLGWWFGHAAKWSFADYVKLIVQYKKDVLGRSYYVYSNELDGPFYKSMYPLQLDVWFNAFSPSQFTFIPFKYVIADSPDQFGSSPLMRYVWENIGVPEAHNPRNLTKWHNQVNHSSLKDDLDEELLQRFQKLCDEIASARLVADRLASSGASLYGYSGNQSDPVAISEWLADHW